MNLESDITTLKGVGEKSAALFRKLNILTLRDLLFFYPRDYETFEEPLPISKTPCGKVCAIRGLVTAAPAVKQVRGLKILTVTVKDETGAMQLVCFNMPYLKNVLKSGQFYLFRGIPQEKSGHAKVMEQPRIYGEEEYRALMASIQPRYPLTKGLTNTMLVKAARQVLSQCDMPKDALPQAVKTEHALMDYKDALLAIHFPESRQQLLEARRALVFREFFFFAAMLRRSREEVFKEKNACPMIETAESARFAEALPYRLTAAQRRVIEEIKEDMTGSHVMNRLVQGDVGSGKTIVAIWALLLAVSNGYQGAMMAPTEVLARQHFEAITAMTKAQGLPFKPVLLTGSQTAAVKKSIREQLLDGTANLVVGTHAVIQDKVLFQKLGLVITDEQHRFGVRQREELKSKGNHPHVLVMSATPIPRTLAIILYGDLKISVIDELPGGRKKIKNCVVGPQFRQKAYAFIEAEVAAGRQAYCICPMVEAGEAEGAENVSEYTEKLRAVLPPSVRVASLHGKMRAADKNRIMESFLAGDIDVLVSTTVIEVGINVPNATVMMVENAERFGLAQLHQLRGRVGRGEHQSYCIFLNTNDTQETKERLDILNRSNDGFYIAGEDLRLRGPGDLFGIRQSGDLQFKLGDIYNDAAILKEAAESAERYGDQLLKAGVLDVRFADGVDFTSI